MITAILRLVFSLIGIFVVVVVLWPQVPPTLSIIVFFLLLRVVNEDFLSDMEQERRKEARLWLRDVAAEMARSKQAGGQGR